MKYFNYLVKAFGYDNHYDFTSTAFRILYVKKTDSLLLFSALLGALRSYVQNLFGLDVVVYIAFVILIAAELQTGVKASIRNGDRFRSRKFGRMPAKVGVFSIILFVLYQFASRIEVPSILGFEINPFKWLYYFVFTSIVVQLLVSYFENLAALGYKETQGLVGGILRKYNQWFEFDGTKNPDKDNE